VTLVVRGWPTTRRLAAAAAIVCGVTEVSWAGVRERLASLASARAREKVFGASGHGFVLYPTLTAAELVDLERFAGVRLPADYRGFLLEVGSGGVGPGYGLERPQRAADGWRWTGHGVTTVAKLSVPFRPFDPRVNAEHDATRPAPQDFPDHASYVEASRAWVRRADELHDEENFGAITLSHQGCGYYWLLVVSGPERGTMWDDSRASDGPLSPLTGPAGERLSFARWYLDWLAEAEAVVAAAGED
jgi:hypothetical protein